MYVEQLRELVDELEAPLLTGATRQSRRDELFTQFKAGSIRLLAVSKVANFAVDLPDASVAIQVPGLSVLVRRRPSDWAAFCGLSRVRTRRTSTPWSLRIRSNRILR